MTPALDIYLRSQRKQRDWGEVLDLSCDCGAGNPFSARFGLKHFDWCVRMKAWLVHTPGCTARRPDGTVIEGWCVCKQSACRPAAQKCRFCDAPATHCFEDDSDRHYPVCARCFDEPYPLSPCSSHRPADQKPTKALETPGPVPMTVSDALALYRNIDELIAIAERLHIRTLSDRLESK